MKILNTTVKVKHLVVLFVLLFALKFVAIHKHKKFNHKRFAQKEWVEKRGERPDFNRGNQHRGQRNFRHDFKDLSKIERNSIDSLKSLMVRGDHENNVEIMKQIKGIVKGN